MNPTGGLEVRGRQGSEADADLDDLRPQEVQQLNLFPLLPTRVGSTLGVTIAFAMLIMMRVGRRVSALLIPVVVLSVCSWLLLFQSRPFSGRVPGASQPVATPAAVEIVVASLSTQNTSWVHSHLPGWLRSVYVVDDPSAKLTVPKNKGHEAMVYLRYTLAESQPPDSC